MARLPRLKNVVPIADQGGRPTNALILFWQRAMEANEAVDLLQQEQIDDIIAAQSTADGAAATIAGHVLAADPHPQYQLESRAKQRFVS